MMHRRSIQIAATLAMLLAPPGAWAQLSGGSVTTSPLGQQAPALGMPLFVVVAILLAGVGMYRLRRSAGALLVAFVLATAITVWAAGPPIITLTGADCTKTTVSVFDPTTEPTLLTNACSGPLKIVAIELECDHNLHTPAGDGGAANNFPQCEIGQILEAGATCDLPVCFC